MEWQDITAAGTQKIVKNYAVLKVCRQDFIKLGYLFGTKEKCRTYIKLYSEIAKESGGSIKLDSLHGTIFEAKERAAALCKKSIADSKAKGEQEGVIYSMRVEEELEFFENECGV